MKKREKIIILVILLIAIFLGFSFSTYAKYTFNSIWNYYLNSKGFYLNSDDLDTFAKKYVDNAWDGSSISFNIRNNLNKTVITSYNIDYMVTCSIEGDASAYAKCTLNGTNDNIINDTIKSTKKCVNNTNDGVEVSGFTENKCINGKYDYKEQIAIKNLYFDIELLDNSYILEDITVNIVVTSTSPYSKTLLGKYILHKVKNQNEGLNYVYKNYNNSGNLIISNSNSTKKCINVSWDASKIRIESEAELFKDYKSDEEGYINNISYDLLSKKSVNFIFYKIGNYSYNITDFIIKEC